MAAKPIGAVRIVAPADPARISNVVVDLDGTLIRTDMLWEILLHLIRQAPLAILKSPFWLLRGMPYMKARWAEIVVFDPASLPYNEGVLDALAELKRDGASLVLATGSSKLVAVRINEHLKLFDEVLATDETVNLTGKNKADAIRKLLGDQPFIYAGNARPDLKVWSTCAEAWVVSSNAKLLSEARSVSNVTRTFADPGSRIRTLIKAARPHQWVKNILIAVPLALSNRLTELGEWRLVALSFLSFGLCASSVYLLNDLVDLESDRKHAKKRFRPLAAGTLSIKHGLVMSVACLGLSAAVSCLLPPMFRLSLAVYYAFTLAYSFRLKRTVMLDVVCLASLYTMRIIAGCAATGTIYSPWLLGFSIFTFVSLALVKRTSELGPLLAAHGHTIPGRGYSTRDMAPLVAMGCSAGYLSVVVLALFLQSREVMLAYRHPMVLWLVCPIQLYWISRIWILAHRGKVDEDPILFALKDRTSYYAAVTLIVVAAVAKGYFL